MPKVTAAMAAWGACALAGTASAQAPAFTGWQAGPEIGLHEHHVYLEVTDARTGQRISSRYYRKAGLGGGAFLGRDWAIGPRLRLGGEVSLSVGGDHPVARFPDGSSYTQHPRYGVKAVVRGGYVVGERVLLYATGGYGGHRYRPGGTARVEDVNGWGSSFVIGAGAEYRMSGRMGVRIDFKHLDNQMSHFLVGVPIRF